MMCVFVDSFYFFAILNPSDAAHATAVEFSKHNSASLVTTTAVLTEVADGLARSSHRGALRRIIASFRAIESHEIVAMNDALFEKAVDLYDGRRDKQWSLTDCISFVVMTDLGLHEALTGDHHYEQAGFTAILRS
jgi:uncharacterized protein